MPSKKIERKRLNLAIPIDLYNEAKVIVDNSDIKDITSFITTAINNLVKFSTVKEGFVLYEDLDKISKIIKVLYEVKRFKNPNVKLEIHYLYNDINKILEDKNISPDTKYHINRLDVSMKELINLELSCKDLDVLIKNNIIKEGVYYAK